MTMSVCDVGIRMLLCFLFCLLLSRNYSKVYALLIVDCRLLSDLWILQVYSCKTQQVPFCRIKLFEFQFRTIVLKIIERVTRVMGLTFHEMLYEIMKHKMRRKMIIKGCYCCCIVQLVLESKAGLKKEGLQQMRCDLYKYTRVNCGLNFSTNVHLRY